MQQQNSMTFVTASGSLYEVNQEKKQIRRLNGVKDPTPRQGNDGEWKTYYDISHLEVGKPVAIIWGRNGLIARTTLTSPIREFPALN